MTKGAIEHKIQLSSIMALEIDGRNPPMQHSVPERRKDRKIKKKRESENT